MIILYRRMGAFDIVQPVVLIDALRSDDRFGTSEIADIVEKVPKALNGFRLEKPIVFSVEYSATYSQTGVNPGDSWRARFFGTVKNPPAFMVSMFSPRFFASTESMEALTAVVQRVVNPETTIVYAKMCVRGVAGIVEKNFVAYAAPHRPIPGTTDTEMQIHGAAFDDLIIKAKKAIRFVTTEPLKAQLEKWLPEFKNKIVWGTKENPLDVNRKPLSNLFCPAAPLNDALGSLCTQNLLTYDIDNGVLTFLDTRAGGSPKTAGQIEGSFLGTAGIMIYNFALSNYTQGQFSADIFDVKMFSSITIYNDIRSAVFTGLNKIASQPEQKKSFFRTVATLVSKPIDKYGFYIIAYDLTDGRDIKQLKITATNNWLVSQAKVEALLEGQVYIDAIKK